MQLKRLKLLPKSKQAIVFCTMLTKNKLRFNLTGEFYFNTLFKFHNFSNINKQVFNVSNIHVWVTTIV